MDLTPKQRDDAIDAMKQLIKVMIQQLTGMHNVLNAMHSKYVPPEKKP